MQQIHHSLSSGLPFEKCSIAFLAFDRGETFAGVDFKTGIETVNELRKYIPNGFTMTEFALKWILMHRQVSTVITGAKTIKQILENAHASEMPDLNDNTMKIVNEMYEQKIKPLVHQYW